MDKLTVKDVANAAIGIFTTDSVRIAEENWGAEHDSIPMMKRVFLAAMRGIPYADITDEMMDEFEDAMQEVREEFLDKTEGDEDGMD